MDRAELKGLTDEELDKLIYEATTERYARREQRRTDSINAIINAVKNMCDEGFGDDCVAADDVSSIKADCYMDFNDLLDILRNRYL